MVQLQKPLLGQVLGGELLRLGTLHDQVSEGQAQATLDGQDVGTVLTRCSFEGLRDDVRLRRMQQQIAAYEAAQATFVRLAGLSLFNFLR